MENIPDDILHQIESIKKDYSNGSTTIALNALHVFENAVDIFNSSDHFKKINEIAKQLISSKPAMAALHSILSKALYELSQLDKYSDFPFMAEKIRLSMKKAAFFCLQSAYINTFSNHGNDTVILTCSYSNTFMKFLQYVKDKGDAIRVRALDSIWNGISYGAKIREQCKELGIEAELINIHKLKESRNAIDIFVTGADRLLPDGSIVNGFPSLEIAESLRGIIPYYVIAESFKKHDSNEIEEGFEIIPNALISNIFTDDIFNAD